MLTYPLEAMAADKLHAVVQFGSANTRLKDYYDLLHLSRAGLDTRLLSACVETTFRNNRRPVPATPVLLPGLSRAYAEANQGAWTELLADAGWTDAAPAQFTYIVALVRAFASHAFGAAPAPGESCQRRDSCEVAAPRAMAFA